MELGIRGKYALVTGSSRGIGKQIALSLAGEGCNVAITSRNAQRLDETAAEVRAKGVECLAIPGDSTQLADIQKVFQKITERWGTLHILVNNMGGTEPPPPQSFEEVPEAFWQDTYNRNTGAAVRYTVLAIPFMRKQKWGRVITISSKQGKEGGGKPWYTMAKSAEIAMMKTMALNYELARDGLTFNSVAPGAILTEEGNWAEFQQKEPEKLKARLQATFPMGRLGLAHEVASVVTFVCSDKASLLTGACIPVDGGESKAF